MSKNTAKKWMQIVIAIASAILGALGGSTLTCVAIAAL